LNRNKFNLTRKFPEVKVTWGFERPRQNRR